MKVKRATAVSAWKAEEDSFFFVVHHNPNEASGFDPSRCAQSVFASPWNLFRIANEAGRYFGII